MLSPRPESTPHRRQPRAPNSTQFAPWLFHAKCQINTLINPRLGNIVTAHRKHCPRETTSRSVASIVVACRGPTAAVSLFLGNTTHGTLARGGGGLRVHTANDPMSVRRRNYSVPGWYSVPRCGQPWNQVVPGTLVCAGELCAAVELQFSCRLSHVGPAFTLFRS